LVAITRHIAPREVVRGRATSIRKDVTAIYQVSIIRKGIDEWRGEKRITTRGKKTIKYGKVEVIAKLPKGDWLWPAIWYDTHLKQLYSTNQVCRMMPEDEVYGVWPRSGEIDIAEARGNAAGYPDGGRDIYTSTLHWGNYVP
jgi:hypothetical protein